MTERKTTWMDLKLARIERDHQEQHTAEWQDARAVLLVALPALDALPYLVDDDLIATSRPLETLQKLLERIRAIEDLLNRMNAESA